MHNHKVPKSKMDVKCQLNAHPDVNFELFLNQDLPAPSDSAALEQP